MSAPGLSAILAPAAADVARGNDGADSTAIEAAPAEELSAARVLEDTPSPAAPEPSETPVLPTETPLQGDTPPEPRSTSEVVAPPAPPAATTLPSVLTNNQMVVFYGTPIASGLGILGLFPPEDAAVRVKAQAALFDDVNGERGAVPSFDLIYAVAADEPTENGLYLRYLDEAIVERYIEVAEQYDLQLILDLQIGRGTVLEEVQKIERFLVNPRIHVAIDPEYAVGPYGAPILTPGQITGHDIAAVQAYVSDLIERHGLPPKLVVVHQFMEATIVDGHVAGEHANVDLVLNMDAFGEDHAKRERYHFFSSQPYAEKKSFNIFLKQDEKVLNEAEVQELAPLPDIVFYQ